MPLILEDFRVGWARILRMPRSIGADLHLFALQVMRPPMARQPAGADASPLGLLLVVVRTLRRLALDLLQHRLNLRPARKRERLASSPMP
jgi:hypothetical protein